MLAWPHPIERLTFETGELLAAHPPVWRHPNKEAVWEVARPAGIAPGPRLRYARWGELNLPPTVTPGVRMFRTLVRDSFYDYLPVPGDPDRVEWHVNFADPHLFGAYGSSLMAQDEMQVAEHPALGSLREALVATGREPMTVEAGRPTPVLVMGAERRCRIATDCNADEGRPDGLYGNAFARADVATVRRATQRIEPPTITNVIAMAAPSGGHGEYTSREIQYVLSTAGTAFRVAGLEAGHGRGRATRVGVHTGFWGCGAFGGNRVLMAMLQLLAAEMAALDVLVFHTGGPTARRDLERARERLERLFPAEAPVAIPEVIERIAAQKFRWGVSDGN